MKLFHVEQNINGMWIRSNLLLWSDSPLLYLMR